MKKIYFAALVLMTGYVSNVLAVDPQSANTTLFGKATVAAQVSVSWVKDLDLKVVTPGVIKAISTSGAVTGIVTGGESIGQFSITKGVNTQVTLALTGLDPLAGQGVISASTLPIVYTHRLSGEATEYTPVTAATVPFSVSNALAPLYFAVAGFKLDLGATVTPATNQAAGDYKGTVTLTATYN